MSMLRGWTGELRTRISRSLIINTREYHVFDNISFPVTSGTDENDSTAQIDHVIVSRYGVFVVENRNRSGLIYGNAYDNDWIQVLYDRKTHFHNPLRQNYLHARSLADFLGAESWKFYPIVVFHGKCRFKTPMPDNVTRFGFISYLKTKKQVLYSDDEVSRLCHQLETLKEYN